MTSHSDGPYSNRWVLHEGCWYWGLSKEFLERKCEPLVEFQPRRTVRSENPFAVEEWLEDKHGVLAPLSGDAADRAYDADRYYLGEDE